MATLLGEWGFLDNLADTSGNGITATATVAPAYTVGPQPLTRALVVDDVTQVIDYGRAGLEPTDTDGGVVSMGWVKLNAAFPGYSLLISKMRAFDSTKHALKVSGTGVWYMARWKDRLMFPGSGTVGDLSDLGWHHLCLVDADDRGELYIDGVSVAATGPVGVGTGNTWDDFPWESGHGAGESVPATDVDMLISGVRLFSGTMTAAEVVDWMNTPIESGTPFGAPEIIDTAPELEQIAVTWGAVADAVGYRLFVDGVEDPAGLIPTTSHTATGLTQGQVYEFTVVAEQADATQSPPSEPVSERASMIVTSHQCLNTATDDPNAGTVLELALGYLPDGTPGLPYLGWRWNARTSPIYWWERESAPRTPVYNYLGAWTDGMTVQFESGDTLRIIEWNRGADIWRQTDISTPGTQHTINLSDLTMNTGTGPIGADVLNCTLLEHAVGTEGWTVRIWGYHPSPIPVDSLTVDDSVPGQLTATWASDWPDVQVRLDGGTWIDKGAATSHLFSGTSAAPHTVEARLTTPIGEGPAIQVAVAGTEGGAVKVGAGDILGAFVGETPVTAIYLGATQIQ